MSVHLPTRHACGYRVQCNPNQCRCPSSANVDQKLLDQGWPVGQFARAYGDLRHPRGQLEVRRSSGSLTGMHEGPSPSGLQVQTRGLAWMIVMRHGHTSLHNQLIGRTGVGAGSHPHCFPHFSGNLHTRLSSLDLHLPHTAPCMTMRCFLSSLGVALSHQSGSHIHNTRRHAVR